MCNNHLASNKSHHQHRMHCNSSHNFPHRIPSHSHLYTCHHCYCRLTDPPYSDCYIPCRLIHSLTYETLGHSSNKPFVDNPDQSILYSSRSDTLCHNTFHTIRVHNHYGTLLYFYHRTLHCHSVLCRASIDNSLSNTLHHMTSSPFCGSSFPCIHYSGLSYIFYHSCNQSIHAYSH